MKPALHRWLSSLVMPLTLLPALATFPSAAHCQQVATGRVADGEDAAPPLAWIRVAEHGTHFVAGEGDTAQRFVVWGVNYDHDQPGRLLEDYWHDQWDTVVEDFQEIRDLGANVVRIHLQLARFLDAPDQPNRANLDQLARLIRLAETTGLYLDITGLGCYHKQDVPDWYDALDESARWDAQARFWREVALVGRDSPAVFCYDLMNEPILPGKQPETEWLTGELGGKYFVQRISLDLKGRTRTEVARQWVRKLTGAIRDVDERHLITVGVIPWAYTFRGAKPLFYSPEVGQPLDFVSVHFYPKKDDVDGALEALSVYELGKPLVVEEIFPLRSSFEQTLEFIDRSRRFADGWISFYWGATIEQNKNKGDLKGAIVAAWLTHFRDQSTKAEPLVFRDVGREVGLLPAAAGIMGHGAGWGDVDGDGWADLYIGTFHYPDTQPNLLFLNRQGKFELDDQPAVRISTRATGVLMADLDNDGDLDLYVGSMPAEAESRLAERAGHAFAGCSLFRNDGQGKFTNISEGNGACPNAFGGRSATVLDYDGDGLLDLLVGEDPIPGYNGSKTKSSRLFRNLGGLQFRDVSREVGLPEEAAGLGVAAADVNQDGWPDLFIASTLGNFLMLNDGQGRFREAPGAREVFAWPTAKGDDMVCGVTIGDVNGDGLPDIVIGQHYSTPWLEPVPNRLYLNRGVKQGVPQFEDVTERVGLVPLPLKGPHVEIQDFDNDGRPDIYTSIVKFAGDRPHPVIFRNLGTRAGLPRFASPALDANDFPTEEDRAVKRSGAFFEKMVADRKIVYSAAGPSCDFDRDGRLDLFLANWWTELPSLLLKNETEAGNWLQVRVQGGGDVNQMGVNRMGIGARVVVYEAGKLGQEDARLGSREIATGFGYASSQEAIAHFGLGDRDAVDIQVVLPHGKGTLERKNVPANQRVELKVISPENESR